MHPIPTLIAAAAVLLGNATGAFAQEAGASAGEIYHRISFPRRATQYVHVESTIPADGEVVELIMPSWTPGSYVIRDYAGHVEGVVAMAPDGRPLPVSKVSKNRWRIVTGGESEAVVEYDVWAGTLGVQESWVESEFALLNGAGIFMYSEAGRKMPQFLEVRSPPDWPRVFVALPGPDGQGRFRARDYDELIDSPLLAGDAAEHRFTAGGAQFSLIDYGHTGQWDGSAAAADLANIAQAQIDFWGLNPFEREFLFLNILLSGKGGLEHDHSTVMIAAPTAMRYRQDYVKWLGLASHELFHAWNVRRMRPQDLDEFNYEEEVYTRQLWLAEGLTSYYDNLMLFRAAVVTAAEFFDLLASEVQQYEMQPGRLVTSAEMASFDSWIRHYRPNPNLVNSNSNYYRKGSVVGFVIDTEIRRATRDRHSLDNAMREMYTRYGPGDGKTAGSYPQGALRGIVTELAGEEVGALLERLLTTPTDPDVETALEWYGLSLQRSPDRDAAQTAGNPPPVDFGVTWQEDTPLLQVEHVLHGSTAAEAGVLPNDELLAIDGQRVTRDNRDLVMKTLRVGEVVELMLVRHQRLMTLDVAVQDAIPPRYAIVATPGVTRTEERRLERWLGRPLRIER